jgi:hypothetical protein
MSRVSSMKAIREDLIEKKFSELDEEELKPFKKILKRIRQIKERIDTLEKNISKDSYKASNLFNPRFDCDAWLMQKTLDQFCDIEIEELEKVQIKVIELSDTKEVIKFLEVLPLSTFKKMRSGVRQNHKKPCIRNNFLSQTKQLQRFMVPKAKESKTKKEIQPKEATKRNMKKDDDKLIDLINIMASEVLQEIRLTKISLFRAKASVLEIGA